MANPTKCNQDGCERNACARGLCNSHYGQYRTSAEFVYIRKGIARGVCTAEECARPEYATGLCRKHYELLRITGSLEGGWFNSARRKEVRGMKARGLTYQQIGETLGISRQRAQQIVAPTPKEAKRFLRVHSACHFCGTRNGEGSRALDGAHVVYRNGAIRMLALCIGCHKKLDAILRSSRGIL